MILLLGNSSKHKTRYVGTEMGILWVHNVPPFYVGKQKLMNAEKEETKLKFS